MKMQFGLGVVAATLFIGCDDNDTAGKTDATDVFETVDAADSSGTEVLAETSPDNGTEETDGVALPDDAIELVGTWATEFGDETISESRWDGFCLQTIVSADNDENVAILETVGGEGCGEGFSRVIWNDIVSEAFDYCTTTYGASTAEDAATAATSGISDDLETGCGGFPWSHLTRK